MALKFNSLMNNGQLTIGNKRKVARALSDHAEYILESKDTFNNKFKKTNLAREYNNTQKSKIGLVKNLIAAILTYLKNN